MTDSSKFVRLHHSNKQRWMIAQNDEDNSWNAGLFSRFDWTEVEGQTYFCQTTYDSATAKEALEAAAADEGAFLAIAGIIGVEGLEGLVLVNKQLNNSS